MTAWAGDERYTALVRQHGDELLRLGVLLTGNRHDAEDAVQDALIAVAGRWTSDEPRSGIAYLRRAVSNRAIDILRGRRDILTHEVPEISREDAALLRYDDDRAFFGMLQGLPTRQRATLILRFYADLDDRTIGRILGCSVATVRSQAHHALNKLRADESLAEGRS